MDVQVHERKKTSRSLAVGLLILVFASSSAGTAFGGPFEDASAAYKRGDYATAFRLIKPMAEQGHAKAQYNLAVMYQNGEGVPQDYAQTRKWFRKAAEQGLADAQYNLGVMYHDGEGVSQDYAEAMKWFRKAAEQGHARAQYNLGIMYDKGEGVPQDYTQTRKWYQKAADQGLADAQFVLGVLYIYGKGKAVPQDHVRAYMWLSLAASRFSAPDIQKTQIAVLHRGILASKMTRAQLTKAQQLVQEWKPKKAGK